MWVPRTFLRTRTHLANPDEELALLDVCRALVISRQETRGDAIIGWQLVKDIQISHDRIVSREK